MNSIRLRAARIALALGLLASLIAAPVEARRGGRFGSRGARTYDAPRATRLAPAEPAPISRSMTERLPAVAGAYRPFQPSGYAGGRPRFGFGGGLLTGLVAGGLIGSLFGHHGYGFGGGYGGGGLLTILIQLAVLGGIVWFVARLFRRRAGVPQTGGWPTPAYAPPSPVPAATADDDDLALTAADQDAFERLLIDLQGAFGREDYAGLRAITTPEIMSYLAEELSNNATHGRRNDVTATRLIDGEVSEAWREADADYATIAMRYESVDVMRDRATGAVLAGSTTSVTETTELWTFVRPTGARAWKVSAIQEA